ncbi:MAG: alpha/beta hydrolase, partial [Cytophagales bacterium]
MKLLTKIVFVLLCGVILYIVGPAPKTPILNETLPIVSQDLEQLEKDVAATEAQHPVKPDNQARIVWANDSVKQKTKYAIVYVHGFSASQEEGNPVHRRIAKAFGCNLYLSRLADHGLDSADLMVNFTCDRLWQTAKEALAIGMSLGDSVILMGTSTGGTLNILMAGKYPIVKAIVNMSPNIAINDPTAVILNNPWGLTLARIVKNGTDNVIEGQSDEFKKYWYTKYRLESAAELEQLLESTMKDHYYAKVTQPTLNLYYYKDELNQDNVVKTTAIIEMHKKLATPEPMKVLKAMPNVGDHVMGSP